MTNSQVDAAAVRAGVAAVGATFSTHDVSDHPVVHAAHGRYALDDNYHSRIGSYLVEHQDTLGVRLVSRKGARGARWEKVHGAEPRSGDEVLLDLARLDGDGVGGAPAAHNDDVGSQQQPPRRDDRAELGPLVPATAVATGKDDIGPQHEGDPSFTAAMRLHQSRYRAQVLLVPWHGVGSHLHPTDGEKGLNFLTPEIFAVVKKRLAQGTGLIDRDRLLCNLLSSQPLCFNLYGPLAVDHVLATRLLRALVPDVQRVTDVRFEFAPTPSTEYLADKTAFDAFIEYERTDGKKAFIGFEVKLTEPFSKAHYDKPQYRRWMVGERSPWRPDAHALVDDTDHNQLWRDHLLAVAMRDHPRSTYAAGRLGLVRHPGDTSCSYVVGRYRELLKSDDETFVDLPLDRILDAWAPIVPDHLAGWLRDLRRRYLSSHR